jgi:hypothetical protein
VFPLNFYFDSFTGNSNAWIEAPKDWHATQNNTKQVLFGRGVSRGPQKLQKRYTIGGIGVQCSTCRQWTLN